MTVPAELEEAFPARPANLHKYAAGVVAVLGGSSRFPHAPVVAGLGARVGGAGLVHLAVPDASRFAAAVLLPEATFLDPTADALPPKVDVAAVGMGLGVSPESTRLVMRFLATYAGRVVLDADALNILAEQTGERGALPFLPPGQLRILTPHEGEAARLLATTAAAVRNDRAAAARELARRYRAVVVLKGPHTLVVSPDSDVPFICPAGNPFMAMGGMGDLLGGLMAARWACLVQRLSATLPPMRVAALAAAGAVWLHAAASDDLVASVEGVDPSLVNTAARIGAWRVRLERGSHGQS